MKHSLFFLGLVSVIGCSSQKAEVGDGDVDNVDTPDSAALTLVFAASPR